MFSDLIKNAKAKYIFLSYNNEGLLSLQDINEIMSSRGKYGFLPKNTIVLKQTTDENILQIKQLNICTM